jgi:DNA-binding CsgD family transcriptional regulator/PAS domain-containing protein
VRDSRSALHELASVLQASPESDALIILGRLLDSLPIGFHVTDCRDSFRILYGNQVWERWLGSARLPVVGKTLADVFPTAAESGVLEIMGDVCRSGEPRHLKNFEFRELGILQRGKAGETSRWDWEIYPLSGPGGAITHLLNVVMDVSPPSPRRARATAAERQAINLQREEASGVLRIFGVAPGTTDRKPGELLSPRERQVADLLALGLTNTGVAQSLNLSSTTISTHVGNILAKLGYRSRAQVAAWVIESRLGQSTAKLPETRDEEAPS